MSEKCPFTFSPLTINDDLKKNFVGYSDHGLVESHPEGWVLGGQYGELYADSIFNMEVREDDVWIATYPKSGTTWTQQLVWLLLNNLDYSATDRMDYRSPHIDLDQTTPIRIFRERLEERKATWSKTGENAHLIEQIDRELEFLSRNRVQDADALPRDKRRLIKSHLPFSLMPQNLLQKAKTIYVARDPRDVVVSYYHHHRLVGHHEYKGDFDQFFDYFINEQVMYSPYWLHISQAWQHKDNKNMLFIFFSDMKKDLLGVINQICSFIGVKYTDDQLKELVEHLRIDNLRQNKSVNDSSDRVKLGLHIGGEGSFVRKGKSGGWKDYLDQEKIHRMEKWKETNAKELDLPLDKLWS